VTTIETDRGAEVGRIERWSRSRDIVKDDGGPEVKKEGRTRRCEKRKMERAPPTPLSRPYGTHFGAATKLGRTRGKRLFLGEIAGGTEAGRPRPPVEERIHSASFTLDCSRANLVKVENH
jgi:hypothetical protein